MTHQTAQFEPTLRISGSMPTGLCMVNINEYQALHTENIELKTKYNEMINQKNDFMEIITKQNKTIDELKNENELLKKQIKELIKQNDVLIEQNNILVNKNNKIEENINLLIKQKNIFEALSKLNDCDALSNNQFKNEYRKWFKYGKYDNNVPNLGQFVDSPPDENDDNDNFKFWKHFCNKYPNSDNKNFRKIYEKMSRDRINCGAHYKIKNLTVNEFENIFELVFPEIYNNDKSLYEDYKNWLYLF